jgi:hypothetical protein
MSQGLIDWSGMVLLIMQQTVVGGNRKLSTFYPQLSRLWCSRMDSAYGLMVSISCGVFASNTN